MQHSGSLRYYSRQISIRYDQIRGGRLDQLVAHFADRGYPVYFVLDEWEEGDFRRLFAEKNVLGKLDWKPIARGGRLDAGRHLRSAQPRLVNAGEDANNSLAARSAALTSDEAHSPTSP